MVQDYLAEIEKLRFLSPVPLLIFSILVAVVVVPICALFFFRYAESTITAMVGIVIGYLLFSGGTLIRNEKIAEIEENYKNKAPTEWVVIQEESLYSMSIQEKSTVNGTKEYFVSRLSTDEITDYKYMIKTELGYQLRTLSKQEIELQEKDIFIKEEVPDIQPKIIIEQREYKESKFNQIFVDHPKRVTFEVPKGTISTDFEKNEEK